MRPRPRRSKAAKKTYVESPLILGDDDDDEPIIVPEDQSEDDDFVAKPDDQLAHEDEEDESVDDADPSSEDESMQDGDGDGAPEDGAKDETSRPKKIRNVGAGMIQSRKNFHDIPHYPLETRIVTRVYAGP
ncbi:hypothetical protein B0T17DRAFT_618164 [Bombardia bombarda]|uniref:Uncharacterized protein n=1 Tax=Bombardia bombarda TaxID=252184 RepID=A0AA40C1R4_9PEZI|nr:hypothetical protein B0T17DRAFT_618164 [Bombardia bombarda]